MVGKRGWLMFVSVIFGHDDIMLRAATLFYLFGRDFEESVVKG